MLISGDMSETFYAAGARVGASLVVTAPPDQCKCLLTAANPGRLTLIGVDRPRQRPCGEFCAVRTFQARCSSGVAAARRGAAADAVAARRSGYPG